MKKNKDNLYIRWVLFDFKDLELILESSNKKDSCGYDYWIFDMEIKGF